MTSDEAIRIGEDVAVLQRDKATAFEKLEVGLRTWDNRAPAVVKKNCANYDWKYGCSFKEKCMMQDEEECEYFERAVAPALTEKQARKYSKHKTDGRYCSCGEPLLKRQRKCAECAAQAKKKSQQKAYRKRRDSHS